LSIDAEKAPVIIAERVDEFILDEEKVDKKSEKKALAEDAPKRETVREKSDAEKTLWLNVSALEEEDIEELLETLIFYEGETPVIFVKNGKKMVCTQKVSPLKALMAELCGFLSESCIKLL
jgi:hypothetical protein